MLSISTQLLPGLTAQPQPASLTFTSVTVQGAECGLQDSVGEVIVEINSPEEIWSHCDPVGIGFESSDQDLSSTFINIELNCDWEEEHGMQWLVKNSDEPIFVGAYDGVSIDFALELDESQGNFA